MIHEELYRDNLTTDSAGEIFTPAFADMSIGYPAQYALGYVRDENCPHQLKVTEGYNNYAPENVGNVEWKNLDTPAYDVFVVGYYGNQNTSFHNRLNALINYEGTERTVLGISSSYPQLLNNFKAKNASAPYLVQIVVYFAGIIGNSRYGYGSTSGSNAVPYSNSFSIEDIDDIISGRQIITFEHQGATITLNELVNNRIIWRDDSDEMIGFYYMSYEITQYTRPHLDDGQLIQYGNTQMGIGLNTDIETTDTHSSIKGFISFGSNPVTGITNLTSGWRPCMRLRVSQNSNLPCPDYDLVNVLKIGENYNGQYGYAYQWYYWLVGDFSGIVDRATVLQESSPRFDYNYTAEKLREYIETLGENPKSIIIQGTDDIAGMCTLVSFNDIWKHMALFPIWKGENATSDIPQQDENWWYAVIVDNEFKGTLIKGNSPDFEKSVPAWVKLNSTDGNDYNPNTDRPTSNPDDPDSDKDVKPPNIEGDSISLQLNRRIDAFSYFITMYNITSQQLSNFGSSIWTNFLDENTSSNFIKNLKYLANETLGTYDVSQIIDLITSVRVYPFSVGTLPITTAGTNKIYIGTGKVGLDVGSQVRILSSTIGILYAGSCFVRPLTPYNDFRDYYNTTVTCFLPYCGTVELNPIEVMNNTIECYYAIDFYTGECTAMLMLTSGNYSYLLAVKNGVIGVLIPITASNSSQLSARFQDDKAQDTKLILSYISEVVNGGISAYHSFTRKRTEKGEQLEDPDIVGGLGNLINMGLGVGRVGATQQQIEANRIGRSAVLAPSLSGGSGGASFFLPDSAYIQIRRGTYSRPDNYASTCAYPNAVTKTLSSLTGLTVCNNVNTDTLNCTDDEKMEIKAILESGVIL